MWHVFLLFSYCSLTKTILWTTLSPWVYTWQFTVVRKWKRYYLHGIKKEIVTTIRTLKQWYGLLMGTQIFLIFVQECFRVTHCTISIRNMPWLYVLRISVDKWKEYGLTIEKARSRRYPPKQITDADYADDLALFSNNFKDSERHLHILAGPTTRI